MVETAGVSAESAGVRRRIRPVAPSNPDREWTAVRTPSRVFPPSPIAARRIRAASQPNATASVGRSPARSHDSRNSRAGVDGSSSLENETTYPGMVREEGKSFVGGAHPSGKRIAEGANAPSSRSVSRCGSDKAENTRTFSLPAGEPGREAGRGDFAFPEAG